MKKIYYLLIFLTFLSFHTKAQIVFMDTLHELGTIAGGSKLHLQYGVYNNDSTPYQLTLRHICGCTEFEKTDYTISGKSFLVIPVTYHSSGNSGHIRRGFYIDYTGKTKGTQKCSFITDIDSINYIGKPPIDSMPCQIFDRLSSNGGTIIEGSSQQFEFNIYNCSNKPLELLNVSASCGCVTPQWSREPIPPGKTGSITATFMSTGRVGNYNKSLTVYTSSNVYILTISGKVIPANDR